jgi:hypothetical protein
MNPDNSEYFNQNTGFYSPNKLYEFDFKFIDFMKKHHSGTHNRVIDVGGGDGFFASNLLEAVPELDITIVDPSEELLKLVPRAEIKRRIGSLPDNLGTEGRFDFIHVRDVFHHITGRSTAESKELVQLSLTNLAKMLTDDGYLLVHELFYESPVKVDFSRNLIFRLLKLQNLTGIKMPSPEFIIGLNVCFYGRREFQGMLKEAGFEIVQYIECVCDRNMKTNLLGINNYGNMLYICKRSNDGPKPF